MLNLPRGWHRPVCVLCLGLWQCLERRARLSLSGREFGRNPAYVLFDDRNSTFWRLTTWSETSDAAFDGFDHICGKCRETWCQHVFCFLLSLSPIFSPAVMVVCQLPFSDAAVCWNVSVTKYITRLKSQGISEAQSTLGNSMWQQAERHAHANTHTHTRLILTFSSSLALHIQNMSHVPTFTC